MENTGDQGYTKTIRLRHRDVSFSLPEVVLPAL